MLIWAIVTLACIGYFLSQAVRAPIIEEDGERPLERLPGQRDSFELAPHDGLSPSLTP